MSWLISELCLFNLVYFLWRSKSCSTLTQGKSKKILLITFISTSGTGLVLDSNYRKYAEYRKSVSVCVYVYKYRYPNVCVYIYTFALPEVNKSCYSYQKGNKPSEQQKEYIGTSKWIAFLAHLSAHNGHFIFNLLQVQESLKIYP